MNGRTDWTLVTVTYNSAEHLRRCWSGVQLDGAHWIVVDNASQDESATVARELGAHVVKLEDNAGFGAANNVGLALAETDWTMFVNPDVVVGPALDLDRLASVARANESLIAPQLLNPDGSEQPNGRGLPFVADKLAHRGVRVPGAQLRAYVRTGLQVPTFVNWAIGAAIGGPTQTFRELGGWDERYFVYYEDHDLGIRSWLSGHPVVLDPRVRWTHEWQRSTVRLKVEPWRHELRSMRIFYTTYPGLRRRRRVMPTDLAKIQERTWNVAREP